MSEHHLTQKRLKDTRHTGLGCRELAHVLSCDRCSKHLKDIFEKAGYLDRSKKHHSNCRCVQCRIENQTHTYQHRQQQGEPEMNFDQKLSELANKLAKDFMDYFKHAYGTPDVPGRLSELVDWRHLANNKFDQLMTWMKMSKTQISNAIQRLGHLDSVVGDHIKQIQFLEQQTRNHDVRMDDQDSFREELDEKLGGKFDSVDARLRMLSDGLEEVRSIAQEAEKEYAGVKAAEQIQTHANRFTRLENRLNEVIDDWAERTKNIEDWISNASQREGEDVQVERLHARIESLKQKSLGFGELKHRMKRVEEKLDSSLVLAEALRELDESHKNLVRRVTASDPIHECRLNNTITGARDLQQRVEKLEKRFEDFSYGDIERLFDANRMLVQRFEELKKKAHHVPSEFVQRTRQALDLVNRVGILESLVGDLVEQTGHPLMERIESIGEGVRWMVEHLKSKKED